MPGALSRFKLGSSGTGVHLDDERAGEPLLGLAGLGKVTLCSHPPTRASSRTQRLTPIGKVWQPLEHPRKRTTEAERASHRGGGRSLPWRLQVDTQELGPAREADRPKTPYQ